MGIPDGMNTPGMWDRMKMHFGMGRIQQILGRNMPNFEQKELTDKAQNLFEHSELAVMQKVATEILSESQVVSWRRMVVVLNTISVFEA